MDSERLQQRLIDRFDADPELARTVAREGRDLDDSGIYEEDFDGALTVEIVIEGLSDAPEEYDVAERWNWWLGALELSHGGYQRFHVRSDLA